MEFQKSVGTLNTCAHVYITCKAYQSPFSFYVDFVDLFILFIIFFEYLSDT